MQDLTFTSKPNENSKIEIPHVAQAILFLNFLHI